MRFWYAVEDHDELFKDYDDAYNYICDMYEGGSSDYYDNLCEEMIYEVNGISELVDWCDGDQDCIVEYEPNYIGTLKVESDF